MFLNRLMKNRALRLGAAFALTASLMLSAACGSPTPTPTPSPSATASPKPPVSSPAVSPTTPPASSPVAKLPYATVAPARTTITNKDIILATTTSVRDSGLLDVLIPIFQQQSGYQVKTIAIGTGAAIAMGSRGDADVLIVHDPPNEVKFMNDGNGANRQFIAHNAFIIVGPTADLAKIKGSKSVTEAFNKIAAANATFVTRGDASGTNSQELRIWNATGIDVSKKPAWYISTGQGMGATLTITSEKAGYTLSDRATYLASKKNLQLDILYENNSETPLLNIYHVIQVNPDKYKDVNAAGAKAFDDFMISPATQKIIGEFGVSQYGEPLFYPDYGKKESDFGSV